MEDETFLAKHFSTNNAQLLLISIILVNLAHVLLHVHDENLLLADRALLLNSCHIRVINLLVLPECHFVLAIFITEAACQRANGNVSIIHVNVKCISTCKLCAAQVTEILSTSSIMLVHVNLHLASSKRLVVTVIAKKSLDVEVLCVDMIFEVVGDNATLRTHQLSIIFLLPANFTDFDCCELALVDVQFVII